MAKKSKDELTVATYDVVTAIEHDGIRYEPDSKIAVDEDAAAPLLAVNAIRTPKASEEAAQ